MNLRDELVLAYPAVDPSVVETALRFHDLLVAGNEVQNLTRLTSPEDFLHGHWVDVWELLKSGLVEFPAMDLGSGCGVPGLLAGIIQNDSWIVVDSEARKAEFLRDTIEQLGMKNVRAVSGRGEKILGSTQVRSIVARAVGPVTRIYTWFRECSTWNTLVLLKGPGWDAEWAEFQLSPHRNELKWADTHEYRVGPEEKRRRIVRLVRVPRGTLK